MKIAKENSGITLVALIVLIIVMTILITMAIYSGVGSIKYVRFMKIKSEIETLQACVNSWHEKSMNDNEIALRGEEINPADYAKELSGIEDTTNYRLYTAKYIVEDIGIDGIENDYLISVIDREVILVGGLIYQGETFFNAEDFELSNTKTDDPISSVSFELHCGNNPKNLKEECIFVHDIKFFYNKREVKISKFNIQYSTDGTNWNTINSTTSKTKYNGNDAYLFTTKDDGIYHVKITDRKGNPIDVIVQDVEESEKSIEVFNCSYPSFKDDNWQIYTPRQLRFLAEYVNNTYTTSGNEKLTNVLANSNHVEADIKTIEESTWIYLMNDIDLGENDWTPIGIGNTELGKYLKCAFDGNNHTIKGIKVERDEEDYNGVFGNAYIIQNLVVKNSHIKGKNNTGGIAGAIINGGKVSNCINYGEVTGEGNIIGGIVGVLGNNGKITDCTSYGNVTGKGNNVGGIVGLTNGSNGQTTVTTCYNSGKVTSEGSEVGGIVGTINGTTEKTTVTKCYNKGEVTGTANKGAIIGKEETSTINELRNLYYLSSLGIGAINNIDDNVNNIRSTTDNFSNLTAFLAALSGGTIN